MVICPRGHDSVTTDYCDECGFPIGATISPIVNAAVALASPTGGDEPCPDCGAPRGGRFCEVCGRDFLSATPAAEPATAPAPDHAAGWRVVASADPKYHADMAGWAMPGAETVAFPAFCPERRFALTGKQLLIGRRSRSRGVEPDIDLTGPPEDPGVSHMHALLVADPHVGWCVVDLASANGTYVNDGINPIPAEQAVPLKDGDEIHLGAWTTLTVHGG